MSNGTDGPYSFRSSRVRVGRRWMRAGPREVLRVLIAARTAMPGERTRTINAPTAVLRVDSLGPDAHQYRNEGFKAE